MAVSTIGFLIISLCFRFTVGDTMVIPVLPAALGYFFVRKGLKPIRQENDTLGLSYKISQIAMFVTIPFLGLYLAGVESWCAPLYHAIKFAEILTAIVLVYIIIEGIHGMEDKYGYIMGSVDLRTMWSIVTAITAVTEAAAYIEKIPIWITAVLLVVKLMFLIMFMQKYIEAAQLYDRRDAQGKMSEEENGPRFRL